LSENFTVYFSCWNANQTRPQFHLPGSLFMMNFERASLNQKLTAIAVCSTTTALVLVFAAFAATTVLEHRKDEAMQLSAYAGVIGGVSAGALGARNRDAAEATLAALQAKEEISNAILYDRKGKPFARYLPPGRSEAFESTTASAVPPDDDALAVANRDAAAFWTTHMRVYRAVAGPREQVGVVMIEADLRPMWLGIAKSLAVLACAMAAALPVAALLAARFKGAVAAPIARLTEAARSVAASQDYSVRIAHARTDEIGALIDSVNHMLAQMEGRGAALAHHRDELERQVGVRTEQLEKAKNAAEAASRAKSAFLATMSHEIRTPMNGVLGMTEMLLGTALSETQRNYTRLVKRSGEHLLVIINDILDFSKIEAGKLSVEYIHFNLWDLLDDINTVYTPQAHAKAVALDFDIANDIPVAICGDPNRLRQVIANLIGNALKFTEHGQILAKVQVAREDAQAVTLRFEVHDTGIGISREARGRIFEAFSQADNSTTRKYGGTGLGLAISKQLVELMGGKIGVENALTQGSIFWFTVSFDKRRVDPDAPGAALPNLEGLRVLIVDEQSSSRAALARQLAAWQVACDGAASAEQAEQWLGAAARKGAPYDVIIVDMELARTSGLALAATVKADPATRAARILLVSDDRLAADPVQRRAAGVAYQLIKPVRAGDLVECIATRARAAPAALLAPAPAAAPATPVALARGRRTRVLLAEDNPVNVEVATAMLDSLGLDVACARNGAEALQAVRASDYDIVLMDCQMPVLDGFAATAEIRRDEQHDDSRRPSLPIIAITANALQGDREACLAAGMDDYLSKPFTQQQLGAVIGRWIALPPPASRPRDDDELRAAPQAASEPAAARAAPAHAYATPAAPATASLHAAASARAALNASALDHIRALSKERGGALVNKVIVAYVDDTPQQLRTLRQAIADVAPGVLRKAAHSLKSSSANVGADALAALCKEMEQLGRTDTTVGAAVLLTDIEQEFQAVRHSLSALLEKET
jgi:two-component system sensor histidine kinase/response regulator